MRGEAFGLEPFPESTVQHDHRLAAGQRPHLTRAPGHGHVHAQPDGLAEGFLGGKARSQVAHAALGPPRAARTPGGQLAIGQHLFGKPLAVALQTGRDAAHIADVGANADFGKLEIVDVGAMDYFTAVKDHVDFTWIFYGWDGVSAELKNEPLNFIKLQDVDKNLDYYTPVIIANEDYLAKNPETAKKFLRAVTKGYQYAIENPEAAADLLLIDNPEIDRELAVASQKYLAAEYQSDAEKWGIMSLDIWENYGKWMYDQGLLENQLNADEAFTNEYLPQ